MITRRADDDGRFVAQIGMIGYRLSAYLSIVTSMLRWFVPRARNWEVHKWRAF